MAIAHDDRSYMDLDPPEGFQAIQAAFPFNRRARPPPMDISSRNNSNPQVPLKQQKVQRRESKGGLRGIFTRNKVEKAAVSPVLEEAPASAMSERTMLAVAEASLPRSMDIPRTNSIPLTPATPATPARPTTMGSRMNLRAKSVRSTKTGKPSPKSSKSSTKSSPRRPPRTSAAWDPPPLFQAYPQAIKHATLSASTLSADAILRMSNHKRNGSTIRDEIAQTGSDGVDLSPAARKTEKAKSKHRRQISGSISKADWTQKIYVLVTSGYLLQYAGEGSFDRLPEKMLQLGRESVAFASDVIPGKHWVLQISQAMDPITGAPAADSRSLLSRLAFRGADYRRTATSLLLVLNSAEDMDSWLAIVRREIEALGGKKHVSETGKPKPDDKIMQLKAQPSHRYLVARDPDQFSPQASPQLPSFGPPPWVKEKDDELQQKLEDAATAMIQPPPSIRPSTGHRSTTNSISSHDGRQLDNLRDSSNRFSYISSDQRTLITSQGSSPATSPTRDSVPSFDDTPKVSIEETRLRPNASAINERRRSMQTMHVPILEAPPNPKIYRHSTYGGPARGGRNHSPGTPNFSVPNSSSKRFSTVRSTAVETPPLPAITTTTLPSRPRDSILKGTRKPPPTALNVTRPLSPVKDSISPKQPPNLTPVIVKHRNSTFEILQQCKPTVIDIPPRSPYPLTPSPTKDNAPPQPNWLSSLIPLNSPELAHVDFQLPRRFSSMQALRETKEREPKSPNEPSRTAPLPPPILPAEEFSESSKDTSPETTRDVSSPLPVLANTKTKMKRPSTQTPLPTTPTINITNGRSPALETHSSPASNRTWPSPAPSLNQPPNSGRPFSITSTASSGTLNRGALSPTGPTPGSMALLSPSLQRVKEQGVNGKMLGNRKSMPTLVNGPPPAPPPDCALPPLPPGGAGLKSPVGVRGGVRA
ncbi:hypothetical protein BDZ45DRAFT_686189 [Acephala macrosclerotiorum]|nr:hypothetical protein BDZ45DRAFT_686189 [Acephala macrosclerotiorum]